MFDQYNTSKLLPTDNRNSIKKQVQELTYKWRSSGKKGFVLLIVKAALRVE